MLFRTILAVLLLLAGACGGSQESASATRVTSNNEQSTPQPIGHRFENAEDWVPRFEGPERTEWQKPEYVMELLEIRPGMAVADIGAGTGYFLPYLSRAVGEEGRVLALDIEPDMVRHMRERAEREGLQNVEARQVAVDDPKLEPESVDRIMLVNTWHHIPNRPSYVRKLAGALTEGGALYVIDYTRDSPRGPPKHHRLPPDRIASELLEGGLRPEVMEEELPYQHVVAGRR